MLAGNVLYRTHPCSVFHKVLSDVWRVHRSPFRLLHGASSLKRVSLVLNLEAIRTVNLLDYLTLTLLTGFCVASDDNGCGIKAKGAKRNTHVCTIPHFSF